MHAITDSFPASSSNKTGSTLEDRVHMIECDGRLKLTWYIVHDYADLHPHVLSEYHGEFIAGVNWDELHAAVNRNCGVGHKAKPIRVLNNVQEAIETFEASQFNESLPLKGDM